MVQRYDYVEIKAVKTDEGFIRDTPVIGRTGLLEYKNADGSTRIEYRPPDEAFNVDSLSSIKSKPVTMGHLAMVSSKNAAAVKPIGAVLSEGRQDGENIVADVVVYTDLPTDKRELSCGYTVDLDETPGVTPDGKHYDAIQRNIRYNHLAVVAKGRAGNARFNLDSAGEQLELKEDSQDMVKVRLDNGIEYDVPQEVKVAFDEKNEALKKATKDKDIAVAAKDVAESKLVEAEKATKAAKEDAQKNFDEAVKARIDMLDVANKHGLTEASKIDNKAIMLGVIKKVHGDSISLDGKSDEYVQAIFDLSKESTTKFDSVARQNTALNAGEHTDSDDDVVDVEKALKQLKADEAVEYLK